MKNIIQRLILTACLVSSGLMAKPAVDNMIPISVQWHADIASTFQFLAHSRSNIGNLGAGVQDALLHAEISHKRNSPVKAILGVGVLEYFNNESTISPYSPIDVGLHYGWIEQRTSRNWSWQLGQLKNKAGLETAVSTYNNHILFGAINKSRSFYYPAARTIYRKNAIELYAEINGPEIPNNVGTSIGSIVNYNAGSLNVNLTHYLDDPVDQFNLVWTQKVQYLNIGADLNYTLFHDNPDWQDDTSLGLAGYLRLDFNSNYLALRGEYFDSGNTGVYGYEKAGVITLTYSKDITPYAFIRYELIYAKSSNNVFKDDTTPVDNQLGAAIQIGMRFGKKP